MNGGHDVVRGTWGHLRAASGERTDMIKIHCTRAWKSQEIKCCIEDR